MENQVFYSKLLLFGEYSLIKGSKALSVPYGGYQGAFSFESERLSKEDSIESNRHLLNYVHFLKKDFTHSTPYYPLDIEAFEKDVLNGLIFDSNIPQGYGVGSSGALIAAMYHKYGIEVISPDEKGQLDEISLLKLKSLFSSLESHFHGLSSGLDPLICYLNQAVLLHHSDKLEMVQLPPKEKERGLFIIDTQQVGKTQPLVQHFMDEIKNPSYLEKIQIQFIPKVNNAIEAYLNHDFDLLFDNFSEISDFQFHYFKKMIPNDMLDLWEEGLDSNSFKIKLCGSGGGGFLLGIAKDYSSLPKQFDNFGIKIV